MLVADRTYEDEQVDVAIAQLGRGATARWMKPFAFNDQNNDFFGAVRWLIHQPQGPVVAHDTVTAAAAYGDLLASLRPSAPAGQVPLTPTVWRTSPIAFARRGDALAPVAQVQAPDTWRQSVVPLTWAYPTPAAQDVGFREVRSHVEHVDPLTPPQAGELTLQGIGTFDPDLLGGQLGAGDAAIRTIQPSQLTARDARSARRWAAGRCCPMAISVATWPSLRRSSPRWPPPRRSAASCSPTLIRRGRSRPSACASPA